MPKKELPVEAYYEAELCECGGIFNTQSGNHYYASSPMRADFKCNKCGRIVTLSQDDFPGVKHRFATTKKEGV